MEENKNNIKEEKAVKKNTRVNKNTKKENIVQEEPQKKGGRLSSRYKSNTEESTIDPKKKLPVRSMVSYPVGYQCKMSHMFVKWSKFGDEHYLTFEEINLMNSEYEGYLHEPILMVDDEEFAEAFDLMGLYEQIFELEDLDAFYKQRTNVVQKKLDALNKNARKSLFLRTIEMIKDGRLTNLGILKLLRDEYGLAIEI